MATQEKIIADLQKRVADLEHRANAQSVRMSTIDDHIKRLEKDMAVPKLVVGDAPKVTSTQIMSKQITSKQAS